VSLWRACLSREAIAAHTRALHRQPRRRRTRGRSRDAPRRRMAMSLCSLYRANAARGGPSMADREEKRTARNRNLFTRMAATPTKAQILAEIGLNKRARRLPQCQSVATWATAARASPTRRAQHPRSCAGCSPCPYHRRVASRRHNKPERYRRGTRRASRSDAGGQPTLAPGTSLAAVEAAGGVARPAPSRLDALSARSFKT
jgi:hypothetical protein